MKILDRYITKEFINPFVFSIAAFTAIFLGTRTLFQIAQYVTKNGASFQAALKLFIYSLPGVIVLTFPLAMLLASLLLFGRLSAASELTAMRSGGISFFRIALPVFVIAFLVSLFATALNELLVPPANAAYSYTVRFDIEKNTKAKSQEHIVIKDVRAGNLENLLYARRYEEAESVMYGVTLEEFQNGNLTRVRNGEKATWQDDQWVMANGTEHTMTLEGRLEGIRQFDSEVIPIDKNPAAISREQKKPEEMTIRELELHIAALQREYVKTNVYEVELHQRLAIPLASFIFTLIGTPLGLQPNRSSSSIGMGISIIVIFIYYTIMTVSSALGQGGLIPAVLAAWLPNLIGIAAGGILIRKASL